MSGIFVMRFSAGLATFLLFCLFSSAGAQGLVLSEIMYNPQGDESDNEFVELYNAGRFPVHLDGYTISDDEGVDTIVSLNQGTLVLPGQFVLILDPDYFTDSSSTYDGLVPTDALVVTLSNSTFGSRGLSNSVSETVTVFDAQGREVASMAYSIGNLDGYSDEKIFLDSTDTPENWSNSKVINGTPGRCNSVTPPLNDLAVVRFEARPALPRIGDAIRMEVSVLNSGLRPWMSDLRLWELFSHDAERLLLAHWHVDLMFHGDSASFAYELVQTSLVQRSFEVELSPADDDSTNNRRRLTINPTGVPHSLAINEIMYKPLAGRSEWVELVNTASFTIAFDSWSFADGIGISDSLSRCRLPDLSVASGEFVILAAESTIFFEAIPPGVQVVVWNSRPPSLNNNGDSLAIFDNVGQVVERVDYRPAWGRDEAGVSLERVSLHSAPNNQENWLSSVDPTGSSPGRINSRALENSGNATSMLQLAPNPFSPDGDGRDDVMVIRCVSGMPSARITVKVYDIRGREVRRLAHHSEVSHETEYIWDGRDGNGHDAPTGLYTVFLEVSSVTAGTRQSKHVAALARPR